MAQKKTSVSSKSDATQPDADKSESTKERRSETSSAPKSVQPSEQPAPDNNADEPNQRPAPKDHGSDGDVRDHQPIRRVGRRRAAGPARGGMAANDDGPSIGGLIFALQQRPSNRPFTVAIVGSVVWILACSILAWAMLGAELQALANPLDLLKQPIIMMLAALVVIPTVLFWFLALLIWRAQELRLMSSAMTEVAVRLAEPDRLAEQSVASLGQTVRRQVAAMNDAISRALGRAGELEALVHNEVAALERSYSENELRIRNLIDELASERKALVNNSEQANEALRGLGTQVSRDINQTGAKVAVSLKEATANMSGELQNAGHQLTTRLQRASDQTAHVLSEKGNVLLSSLSDINQRIAIEVPSLLETLSNEQTRLTKIVESAGKNLAALETAIARSTGGLEKSLSERTQHLQTVLSDYTKNVDTSMGERTKVLDETFSTKARALDAAIGQKLQQFDKSLDVTATRIDRTIFERTQSIDAAFGERLRMMEETIVNGAGSMENSVGEKANILRDAMASHAQNLRSSLDKQVHLMDETVRIGVDAVQTSNDHIAKQSMNTIHSLAGHADVLKQVSDDLLEQIGQLTNRFETQSRSIMRAAHSLEGSNYKIDSTLETRHSELTQLLSSISERADDFERMMRSNSSSLDSAPHRVESDAHAATARMRSAATEVESERALTDLRNRISNAAREGNEPAREVRGQPGEPERQRGSLPSAAMTNSDAVRRSLNEQMKALDTLTSFSSQQARIRDITPPDSGAMPIADDTTRNTRHPAPPVARSGDRPRTAGPQPGAGSEAPRGGWTLGDLLKRASQDDEVQLPMADTIGDSGKPSDAPAATLDIANIAHAIDAGTAGKIWQRYRGGERGLLDRQLYSQNGQIAYDEVNRRYSNEDGFRNTVNRYLMDFEQLLREADKKDPSGDTLQNYLVSETGRVYLLLAHASGRLA